MAGGWIKPRSGRLRECRFRDYLNSRNFGFLRFFCEEPAQGVPYIAGKRVTTGMWVNQVLCDFSTISSPISNQIGSNFGMVL